MSACFLIAVFGSFFISGCVKDNKLYSPEEGRIYVPQAYADRATLSLYRIDSPQTAVFGIAYSGFNSVSTDITAKFVVDTSLITEYNIDNAYLGYQYVALPDSAYAIDSLSTVLKAGTATSLPLTLSIWANKLKMGTRYLLPVKLSSISSGTIDSALSIAYFKIDTLTQRSRDITAEATLSVNYDNEIPDPNQSSPKLVDDDYTSKYLLYTFHTDMWAQLQFPNAVVLNAYTLTSGGDAPERDPRSWNLAASNDRVHWVTLDTRTNQSFPNRTQTIEFDFDNSTAYIYYRLNITANNNDNQGLFQCAEWRVLQFY